MLRRQLDANNDLEEAKMENQPKNPTPQSRRQDRLIHERVHDPYRSKSKLSEPTVCPRCGAVYHQGRWTWMKRPASAHEEMCPACQRVEDKYPAGFLTLGGRFLQDHKEEILNLVRNEEQDENAEHPLNRVMQIEEGTEGIVVTTTDLHLPRRIGEALSRAYQGDIDFHYIEEGSILRVQWTREV
jgi:NMD protein affecting ribosome stability and mRNA decay